MLKTLRLLGKDLPAVLVEDVARLLDGVLRDALLEAALGVLSSLYAGTGTIFASTVGAAGQAANLGEILAANISPAEALAFIFAVTFNIPCVVAVASTYNETHSAKWTVRIAIYYICVALLMSFVVYHVAALFL